MKRCTYQYKLIFMMIFLKLYRTKYLPKISFNDKIYNENKVKEGMGWFILF